MSLASVPVLAQSVSAGGGSQLLAFLPMIAILVVFYFFMIRPQMKRQKETRAMLAALSRGDEVVTSGGMAGRVEAVGESFVTVEIAPEVKIKLQKGAITQVLPKGTLKSA